MDMREEPFVGLWAERLKTALDRTQAIPAGCSGANVPVTGVCPP